MENKKSIKTQSTAGADAEQHLGLAFLSEVGNWLSRCRVRSSSVVPNYDSRFELLVQDSKTPVFRMDLSGEVLFANSSATKIWGEPGASPWLELLPSVLSETAPESQDRPDTAIRHINQIEDPLTGQAYVAFQTTTSESNLITVSLLPIDDSQEELSDNILASAAHEIRSPLVVLHALLSNALIEAPAGSESPAIKSIKRAVHQTETVLRVADNMLDLKYAQSGNLRLFLENTAIHEFIKDVIYDWIASEAIEKERIVLHLENVNAAVDRMRLRQVIENLLSNAIKFTGAGSEILLECWTIDNHAFVAVRDRGPGIPERDLSNIFVPFYRVDPSSSSGHGLGLAISRTICRLHGGDLDYSCRDGGGSSFVAHFPIRESLPSAA